MCAKPNAYAQPRLAAAAALQTSPATVTATTAARPR